MEDSGLIIGDNGVGRGRTLVLFLKSRMVLLIDFSTFVLLLALVLLGLRFLATYTGLFCLFWRDALVGESGACFCDQAGGVLGFLDLSIFILSLMSLFVIPRRGFRLEEERQAGSLESFLIGAIGTLDAETVASIKSAIGVGGVSSPIQRVCECVLERDNE